MRVIEWVAVRPGTVEALVGVAELLALGGEVAHIKDGRVHCTCQLATAAARSIEMALPELCASGCSQSA